MRDYSMWLTITRQVVLPILLAFIFTKTMGMLPLVWAAYVLSELISIPMSIVLMKRILSNTLRYEMGNRQVKERG